MLATNYFIYIEINLTLNIGLEWLRYSAKKLDKLYTSTPYFVTYLIHVFDWDKCWTFQYGYKRYN